ncbi:MAG: glutamine-hydrolyzing GMP synthase, partial [Bryobacteraceae bacterium]
RDTVSLLPPGFQRLAHTNSCAMAAMAHPGNRLYGVQFHPEVAHTRYGIEILSNFLFEICRCRQDWNPAGRAAMLEEGIREAAGRRKVFFFVSGGVDSTVAFTLCLRALGPERVRGVYVDTGLMREGETEFVRGIFQPHRSAFAVLDAQERFLSALAGVYDPEQKRQIIGDEFVRIQQEALDAYHVLDEQWILGQGTIYPDTIESGGTEKAAVIKTHHNRVPAIQRLMEENRVLEPIRLLYKDEVRAVGRELGLPSELLDRHPFPGPGLAVRCLCSQTAAPLRRSADGWLLPVRSVGVQGDSRSYAGVLCLEADSSNAAGLHRRATALINQLAGVNRIVALVESRVPLGQLTGTPGSLERVRLGRLRLADAVVRRLTSQSGYDRAVWQFPVILIPVGAGGAPDSIVLRPVDSVDGMTAESAAMPTELLRAIVSELLAIPDICAVFYDLTHKPPATIEWE